MNNLYDELNQIINNLQKNQPGTEDLQRRITEAVAELSEQFDKKEVVEGEYTTPSFGGLIRLKRVLEIVRDCIVPIAIRMEISKLEGVLGTLASSGVASAAAAASQDNPTPSREPPALSEGSCSLLGGSDEQAILTAHTQDKDQ